LKISFSALVAVALAQVAVVVATEKYNIHSE
jgi:hypothetical protein